MIRLALVFSLAMLLVAALAPTSRSALDCLGPRPVQVDIGKIGALDLALPADSIAHLCGPVRDTVAYGDESLDTAFVFSQRDVLVVARLATIEDTDGHHSYRRTKGTRAMWWDVSGKGAILPGGAPLSSTWADLRRVYGAVRAEPLNGAIYVSICRYPRFRIMMRDPTYATGSWPQPALLDSVLAPTPIDYVVVPARGARDLSESEVRRVVGCPG
jgi:hypothetical protein